jgi:hypothetical protein
MPRRDMTKKPPKVEPPREDQEVIISKQPTEMPPVKTPKKP